MRRIIPNSCLFSCLILSGFLCFSQSVSVNKAKEIARNHLLGVSKNNLKSGSIKNTNFQFSSAKAMVENKDTLYYILNDTINKGFVIVSADQRVWPILGYSTDNSYNEKKKPEAFVDWMDAQKKGIAYVKKNNLQADNQTSEKWRQLESGINVAQSTAVEPLLKTTWDQGCYYNEQCPADALGNCGRVPTGCVATAMAQIMKYWNYPTKGIGNSYLDSKYGQQFADFGASTYNWEQMPNQLNSSNNEVAKLMFHCGVATSVWYCIGGSNIYPGNIPDALTRYFSYSKNIRYISRGTTNNKDWIAILKQELDSKRPILYSGKSAIGHAFVCDGYQNDNYFHFNWGWGGIADGYYYVENITPGIQFNKFQEAIINICPNNPPQGYNGFSLATNALLLTANKSITPVTLISSVNWTASSDQPWLKLSNNAGLASTANLDVIAEENSTGNSRSAIVTVSTAEFGTRTITVTQPAKITTTAGNLRNILVGKLDEMKSITLMGTIDARDFKTMRDEMPMLENVDLSNTSILGYTGTEGTYDSQSRSYNANTIPGYAFKKDDNSDTILYNLHKFVFPSTAITIDSYAFNKCGNLSTFDIPEPVRDIKVFSFAWCWFLTRVNIPASVKSIDFGAFMLCDKLHEINVDKNNTDYSSNDGILFDKNQTALIKCPSNKQGDYIVPQSVKVIKTGAFEVCNLLNSITIPISVDSIETRAIGFCNATVVVNTNNPKYSSREGVLYNKNQTELLFCPSSQKGNFAIPQGVKSIGANAFAGCNITSVTIPNSVSSIGNYSFGYCQGIESIEIPSSVTSIGETAFFGCYKLSTIKIPSSVKFIGNYTFVDCPKLSSIIVGHSIPISLQKEVFSNFDKNTCTLYVPYGSKAAYQAADQWKDFKNIVEAVNGFSLVAATVNIACEGGSTTAVELKANVGWTATSDKNWLTISANSGTSNTLLKFNVEANTSITSRVATVTVSAAGYDSQTIVVTQSATKAVFNVTAGSLSSTLTKAELSVISRLTLTGTIDARDFKTMRDKMPMLEEIDLSKAIIAPYSGAEGTDFINNSAQYAANTVPFSAFMKDWQGKKNLKLIILPASLTKIDWSAFRDCDGLITISIPPSVIEIGGSVFNNCDGLTSIEIPATVSSIGSGVFWNCTNLSSIKVYRSTPIDFVKMSITDVFTGVNKNTCVLYVPFGTKATYQAADQWKDFKNIVEIPDHAPVANAGPDQSANEGTIVTLDGSLSNVAGGQILTYTWTAPAGITLSSTTLAKPTFIAPEVNVDTKYSFTLVVNDGFSNSQVDQVEITVKQVIKVGVDLLESSEFEIYPNPTTGITKIEIPGGKTQSVQVGIFNLQGKKIYGESNFGDNCLIDFSSFKDGIYLLKIKTENKNYIAKVILKR